MKIFFFLTKSIKLFPFLSFLLCLVHAEFFDILYLCWEKVLYQVRHRQNEVVWNILEWFVTNTSKELKNNETDAAMTSIANDKLFRALQLLDSSILFVKGATLPKSTFFCENFTFSSFYLFFPPPSLFFTLFIYSFLSLFAILMYAI